MKFFTFVLAGLLFVGAAGAISAAELPTPETPGLSTSERLEALVERVKIEQGRVRSLEAGFVQTKESEMLLEPELARGVFSFEAPDRVRWEYSEPNPITVLVTDESMTTWYRDLSRADVVEIGRYSSQVFRFMGAGGSVDQLLDYFRVTVRFPEDPDDPYRMDLDPRFERIAKRVAAISIWIDRDKFLPIRLRYQEGDGDATEYAFQDVQVNGTIPPERFVLELPDSVTRRVVEVGQESR